MDLVDLDLSPGADPAASLMSYFHALPLFELCDELVRDACGLVKQAFLLMQADPVADVQTLCANTLRYEDSIFQYASTDSRCSIAKWVLHYSPEVDATDSQATYAYILAVSIRALGVIREWIHETVEKAISLKPTILSAPWEAFCSEVELHARPDDRIRALEDFVLCLEPITMMSTVEDADTVPMARSAIRSALRKKGGLLSGEDRREELTARDQALIAHALGLINRGLARRNVPTRVHDWLVRQVSLPAHSRPKWLPVDVDKALTRRQIASILRKHDIC